MFVPSIFWALMADIFRLEQSRRLFGFLAVGGTLARCWAPGSRRAACTRSAAWA
jgi:AAA family ATP:ADP antiporter